MNRSPLAAVVVLGWNNERDLPECFGSLGKQDYSNYKLIYVDNASTDNSLTLVKRDFPNVDIISLHKNIFYTGGNNAGIRYAIDHFHAEFVAVLNPDTVVQPNWLRCQIEVMQSDQRVGIVGPKVVFATTFGPDANQVSTPQQSIINTTGLLPGGFLFPYDRGYGEEDSGQFNKREEVFGVSGVSMLLRVEMLKQIGLFFNPMKMYLEDADLCTRARKAGWRIIYTPNTKVEHKHMQSTKQRKDDIYNRLKYRNYLLLVARNYPLRKTLRAVWQTIIELGLFQATRTIAQFLLTFPQKNMS